jgi:hypothetical protein
MQLRSTPERSQVLWGGIIICVFAIIGWLALLRVVFALGGYAPDVEPSGPAFFLVAVLSFIGSFMITYSVKKSDKRRQLRRLTKGAVIIFTVSLIILGASLVGFSMKLPSSIEHLTETAHQENPGANYTMLSNGGIYLIDLTVTNTSGITLTSFPITDTNLENNKTSSVGVSYVGEHTIQAYDLLGAGHYRIAWDGLNVTQIIVYLRTDESTNVSRFNLWIEGLLTLIVGITSLFGFEIEASFQGEKAGIFWWGLILFGLALSWLFAVLWFGIIVLANVPFLSSIYGVGQILPDLAFLYLGFRMMKGGAIKGSQTYAAIGQKTSRLKSYLSQRNYRGLIYLLASALIIALGLGGGSVIGIVVSYVDLIGDVFGWLLLGWDWINPAYSILRYAILVFGLFVEIFIICEFFIIVNGASRTK